jgi:hypothetical protein
MCKGMRFWTLGLGISMQKKALSGYWDAKIKKQ